MRRVAVGLAVVGVAASGCGGAGNADADEQILVLAAASLTEAFQDIGVASSLNAVFSFDSSAVLATQILEGAPADVFASAATGPMDDVVGAGAATGDPAVFATNVLVVIVPVDNPAGIEDPADLAVEGIDVVLAAEEVPAGRYARQYFEMQGIAAAVEANVVSNEENVRGVLERVALGEADAGVVYVTDARTNADVQIIPIPEEDNVIATYPIVRLAAGPNQAGAGAFLEFVLSSGGQHILAEHGFGPAV
jgi:molybdate transport system substrate-binding protein